MKKFSQLLEKVDVYITKIRKNTLITMIPTEIRNSDYDVYKKNCKYFTRKTRGNLIPL